MDHLDDVNFNSKKHNSHLHPNGPFGWTNEHVILDGSKQQREGAMVLCICVIIFVAVRENSFETSQI